jgi:hypothetical protein
MSINISGDHFGVKRQPAVGCPDLSVVGWLVAASTLFNAHTGGMKTKRFIKNDVGARAAVKAGLGLIVGSSILWGALMLTGYFSGAMIAAGVGAIGAVVLVVSGSGERHGDSCA